MIIFFVSEHSVSSSGFSLTLLLGLLGVLLLVVICGALMLIKLKNHSRFIVMYIITQTEFVMSSGNMGRSVIIRNVCLKAGCTADTGEVDKERSTALVVSESV